MQRFGQEDAWLNYYEFKEGAPNMAEEKNYIDILNKARRRRKRDQYKKYVMFGVAAVVAAAGIAVAVGHFRGDPAGSGEKPAAVRAEGADGNTQESEAVISSEELEAQKEAQEKQAVVDSYTNLGMVQLQDGGYLNIRETPTDESMANIIGKIPGKGACEVLGEEENGWYHIQTGGVDGYISSQYVLTGEEARQKALEYAAKMAVVTMGEENETLRIRQTPDASSLDNVVGQAANGSRYPVLGEQDGWVQIREGYISSEFVTIEMGLSEGEKLDLKTMALNQYDNLLISRVDNYLNIRSEPKVDAYDENVIGKLPSDAAGEILETLDGWYKIKSGPITGYVSADHVATGPEARDLALRTAQLTAIVNTDMLNVRTEPSTESSIWTQISKEERYHVLDQLDGWVQIELDAGDGEGEEVDKAYISTRDNNVEVRYALPEAIKFSPLEERANQQASLRSKVVNYGLKFVGGRYVWGGTNPNTGADCSGFVQYVMRNAAGVSLPRTSREQAKVGRSIKSSEMLPGDLIFYANSGGTVNHVAMYIGNGQIVHAASRKSGIKISTWNYRSPKTIRRVLN